MTAGFLGARESARSREGAVMRHDDPARICPGRCQITDPETAAGLRAAAAKAVGPQWETPVRLDQAAENHRTAVSGGDASSGLADPGRSLVC
jgi:hypothetical protein